MREIGHAFMLYSMDNKAIGRWGCMLQLHYPSGAPTRRSKVWYDYISRYLSHRSA
jgi:hypothetical protein